MQKIQLFICTILLIIACKKEETEKIPILITSEVQNVSVYNASDGSIIVTVSGGSEPYTYLWSTGAVTKDLTDIPAGTYTVIVTDAVGDTASHTKVVSTPSELVVEYEKTDVTTTGGNNGTIALNISGGTPPYSTLWNTGAITDSISNLTAGSYTAIVTDNAGDEKEVVVQILDGLSITATATDVTTYNGNNGSIDLTVYGGQTPYTFIWSNGCNDDDLSSLEAGYYTVTVTDADLKTRTRGVTVYEAYNKTTPEAEMLSDIHRMKQSGLRIEYDDLIIYIDPINLYEGNTADADIIMITHSHDDHYNPGIINQLKKAGTSILVPVEIYSAVSASAGSATVLQIAPDSVKTINGIAIEVVPAYNSNHSLPNSVGYILTLNGLRVYHSGDTELINEMDNFDVDIACLPAGLTYTFHTVQGIADAATAVQAKVILAIHYDGLYEINPESPWELKEMLEGNIDVWMQKPCIE